MFINATNWGDRREHDVAVDRQAQLFQRLGQGRIENALHDAQERAEAEIDRGAPQNRPFRRALIDQIVTGRPIPG